MEKRLLLLLLQIDAMNLVWFQWMERFIKNRNVRLFHSSLKFFCCDCLAAVRTHFQTVHYSNTFRMPSIRFFFMNEKNTNHIFV